MILAHTKHTAKEKFDSGWQYSLHDGSILCNKIFEWVVNRVDIKERNMFLEFLPA